jgi:hypothetical protein
MMINVRIKSSSCLFGSVNRMLSSIANNVVQTGSEYILIGMLTNGTFLINHSIEEIKEIIELKMMNTFVLNLSSSSLKSI